MRLKPLLMAIIPWLTFSTCKRVENKDLPNIIFIFADDWRLTQYGIINREVPIYKLEDL